MTIISTGTNYTENQDKIPKFIINPHLFDVGSLRLYTLIDYDYTGSIATTEEDFIFTEPSKQNPWIKAFNNLLSVSIQLNESEEDFIEEYYKNFKVD